MSKYIIEVDDNAVCGLFKVKGFAMAFDKDGLDKLQKYEEPVEEQTWPQFGDIYFFLLADGEIRTGVWYDNDVDNERFAFGNVFKSEEEAEFAREQRKVLGEMRKFTESLDTRWDGATYHWYIYYGIGCKCLGVDNNNLMRGGKLYFESEERAWECIEAVGEDRIKKYYIGVE